MRDILGDLLTSDQPFHSDLSIPQARAALSRLLAVELSPASGERAAAAETLRRVYSEWNTATSHEHRSADAPCPACTSVWITLVRASRHLPHCPNHPALDRLEAAADTLLARAGEEPGTRVLLHEADALLDARAPHDCPFPYLPGHEVTGALERLAAQPAARLTEEEAALLDALVEDWSRAYHPEADPCPFCGAATPLAGRLSHLLACPRHPAALLAGRLEAVLRSRAGQAPAAALLAAFTERNAHRDALRLLIQGCAHYESEWGYEEHGVYCSKRYAEAPWLYDLDRAERLLGAAPSALASGDGGGAEPARVREEAARWRAALEALRAACSSLWNRMDDGDRGKSLISERIIPPWHEAIEAAKAVMEREGAPLWKSYGGGLRGR